MPKVIDLTGQRFGRLKVTRLIGKDKSQNRLKGNSNNSESSHLKCDLMEVQE